VKQPIFHQRNECIICGSTQLEKLFDSKDFFLTKENYSLIKCRDCSLILTTPYPDESNAAAYYESQNYFSHQDRKEGTIAKIYNLVKILNVKKKYQVATKNLTVGKVFDIGCGTGDFLSYSKKHAWEIFGLEPNNDARKLAEEKLQTQLLKSIEQAELKSEEIQLITLWHVLEHIYKPEELMRFIDKVLDKNGRLVVALPNYESYDAVYYRKYWAAFDLPRHLFHFNKKSIVQLMNKHGLVLKKIVPMRWDAYYVSILSEKYKNPESISFFVKGLYKGFISNFKAKRTMNYSSLIYIFEKK